MLACIVTLNHSEFPGDHSRAGILLLGHGLMAGHSNRMIDGYCRDIHAENIKSTDSIPTLP